MNRVARLSLMAALTLAGAGAVPVLAAVPAQADANQCVEFLEVNGVDVTDAHVAACRTGQQGNFEGCVQELLDLQTLPPVVFPACQIAQD